ncbi:MAG TPA: amidohydrolase [Candidatus Polarisedimenticolia bacterium]|nr:amidohydrolase [Candidatus Polarisedimenticolia bacterium]
MPSDRPAMQLVAAIMLFMTGLMGPGAAAQPPAPGADLILHGSTFHTVDPARPTAEAVAVRAGRIIYVGDVAGAMRLREPKTRLLDLAGATVVPGLIDAHGHISGLGFALSRLDLVGSSSEDEVASMVRGKASTLAPGQWVTGRGWDQNDWEVKAFPSARSLDRASPANPVSLVRVDGHAIWVNSAAMKLAGVTRATADPPGGQIVRDAEEEPTGVFVDNAKALIESKIAAPGRAELRGAIESAMRRCLKAGLVGVHDAGVSAEEIGIYRDLLVKEAFPFRIHAMLDNSPALLEEYFARGPESGLGDGRLNIRAVKLYSDGALGSRGAALLAPYEDDAGNTGLLVTEPEAVRDVAIRAARAGFQPCIHAIGDRGNRVSLDALEAAVRASGRSDVRARVEHAQVLALEDIPRFAAGGIIASMQPTHATSDMYWAEARVGPQRIRGAYAWRRLFESKARLACGSDFPVESENPLLGFYAAVTRQDAKGWPAGGWAPGQRMTRQEALSCFTLDAAYASFEEDSRGSIVVGKRADLTVLSSDILRVPAREILAARVLMTIVGGDVAWNSREAREPR